LHGNVVEQKGKGDGDDDGRFDSLNDSSLVELLYDNGAADLFPLNSVVGEHWRERMSVILTNTRKPNSTHPSLQPSAT